MTRKKPQPNVPQFGALVPFTYLSLAEQRERVHEDAHLAVMYLRRLLDDKAWEVVGIAIKRLEEQHEKHGDNLWRRDAEGLYADMMTKVADAIVIGAVWRAKHK